MIWTASTIKLDWSTLKRNTEYAEGTAEVATAPNLTHHQEQTLIEFFYRELPRFTAPKVISEHTIKDKSFRSHLRERACASLQT